MSTTFDRWLARLTSLRLLRYLVYSDIPVCTSRRRLASSGKSHECARSLSTGTARKHASSTPYATEELWPNSAEFKSLLRPSKTWANDLMKKLNRVGGHDVQRTPISGDQSTVEDAEQAFRSGKLAVDEPGNESNMALWSRYLRRLHRLQGWDGVLAVWEGMRLRNIDLPIHGEHADYLWKAFLYADLTLPSGRVSLMSSVWQYAQDLKQRTGQHYEGLYKLVVGRSLRLEPSEAMEWHDILTAKGFSPPDPARHILADAMEAPGYAFTESFVKIYEKGSERDLYEHFVSEALKHKAEGWDSARLFLRWHQLFVSHDDLPSVEIRSTPLVQKFLALDCASSNTESSATDHIDGRTSEGLEETRRAPSVARITSNDVLAEAHGIKPKQVSDEFCAKMFATRVLSIDFVLRGLSFLGVEKLGPIALHEWVIRSASWSEFKQSLTKLEPFKISLGENGFTRLVSKLADEDDPSMWQAVRGCDVHAEEYDNIDTLESALELSLRREMHMQAELIRLALELIGSEGHERALNILLHHNLRSSDYSSALSSINEMISRQLTFDQNSLLLLKDLFLPSRRSGRRVHLQSAPRNFEDRHQVVARVFLYTTLAGDGSKSSVSSDIWTEIFKRYGKGRRWQELEKLLMWLIYAGSANEQQSFQSSLLAVERPKAKPPLAQTLDPLFPKVMQKATVYWAFQYASLECGLSPLPQRLETSYEGHSMTLPRPQCEPWAQGLALLQKYRELGGTVDRTTVRKAFITIMWKVFGPAFAWKGINYELRRRNRLSLAHYIRHANEVFHKLFYWIPAELLLEDRADPRLLTKFFNRYPRTNRMSDEYADVEAWANWLAQSDSIAFDDGQSLSDKFVAWKRSPFRLTRAQRRRRLQREAAANKRAVSASKAFASKAKVARDVKEAADLNDLNDLDDLIFYPMSVPRQETGSTAD